MFTRRVKLTDLFPVNSYAEIESAVLRNSAQEEMLSTIRQAEALVRALAAEETSKEQAEKSKDSSK